MEKLGTQLGKMSKWGLTIARLEWFLHLWKLYKWLENAPNHLALRWLMECVLCKCGPPQVRLTDTRNKSQVKGEAKVPRCCLLGYKADV